MNANTEDEEVRLRVPASLVKDLKLVSTSHSHDSPSQLAHTALRDFVRQSFKDIVIQLVENKQKEVTK